MCEAQSRGGECACVCSSPLPLPLPARKEGDSSPPLSCCLVDRGGSPGLCRRGPVWCQGLSGPRDLISPLHLVAYPPGQERPVVREPPTQQWPRTVGAFFLAVWWLPRGVFFRRLVCEKETQQRQQHFACISSCLCKVTRRCGTRGRSETGRRLAAALGLGMRTRPARRAGTLGAHTPSP